MCLPPPTCPKHRPGTPPPPPPTTPLQNPKTNHSIRSRTDWAEDEDADDASVLPPPEITKNADGTETHISYRWREDGKKIRTTRIIKKTLLKHKVNPRIAERRGWAKFGLSAKDPRGPQSDTTSVGENIELNPRQGFRGADKEDAADAMGELEKKKNALKNATVKCRICNGEHFTARCPFKDTMAPEGEPPAGEPIADPMAEAAGGVGAGVKGSYVPPALRKGGSAAAGERMGGKYERDDLATLRVTNVRILLVVLDARDAPADEFHRSASGPRRASCATCSSAGVVSPGSSWPRTETLAEPRALPLSALQTARTRRRRVRRWTASATTTSFCASSLRRSLRKENGREYLTIPSWHQEHGDMSSRRFKASQMDDDEWESVTCMALGCVPTYGLQSTALDLVQRSVIEPGSHHPLDVLEIHLANMRGTRHCTKRSRSTWSIRTGCWERADIAQRAT